MYQESLLTVNNLGCIIRGTDLFNVESEFGNCSLLLYAYEVNRLIDTIIKGKDDIIKHSQHFDVIVEFPQPGQVTLHWTSGNGSERATFDEIQLTKILDVLRVREVAAARIKAGK